jgi:hypothetical protein
MLKCTITRFATIIILAITITSCCTKKDCINGFELGEIKLEGFLLSETENILISSYVKNTDFRLIMDLDSTSAHGTAGSSVLTLFSPIELNKDYDYLIEFKNIGETYKITSIETGIEKCNTCFLKSDDQETLASFNINGSVSHEAYFRIVK